MTASSQRAHPGCTTRYTRALPASLIVWAGLCVLLMGASARTVQGQGVGPIQSEVSVFGAGASTEALPFWLGANQYGRLGRSGTPLGARLAAWRPFSGAKGGLDYAVGASLLGRASANSTLHVQELYGQLRYGPLQLTAGWKKQVIGRVDTARSLGGITRSENATPLPKVRVSTPGYVPVPGTNGFLGVKGYLAHGWMGADRVVQNAFLHEKYGYLRLLPPEGPVTLHAGLIHHAVWGGRRRTRWRAGRRGPSGTAFGSSAACSSRCGAPMRWAPTTWATTTSAST